MRRDTKKRDAEIVELIHKNSIRILEELGIEILWEDARRLLSEKGVRVEGNRAYFTEKQVMDALDVTKKEFTIFARNSKYNVEMNTEDLYMTPGYGSPFICEADGTFRSATLDDFLKLAVIVQESDEFAINGGILAQPSDIDAGISAEAMVYATICRSDKALFTVCGGAVQAENIVKMAKVIFGDDITEKPCTINLISPMSPLILTQNTLESIEVYARNGQPLAICPASMAGATGPISVIGNVSLSNAEFLASNTYAQMVRPGTPVIYAFAATVSDMANMQVYDSNPGFLKVAKYGALMSKKYGLPCRSGGGMADAPGLTAQAGVESAMNMFESFSQKANLMMHAAGSLLSFNAVSYEKFILDIETYTRMMYYFGETPADEDALAFDAIKEAVEEEGGTFITLDHTFERCRIDPWYPQVSLHKDTGEEPGQALLKSIRKRLNALLDGYERPELSEGQRKALDDIMRGIGMKEEDIARI